MHSTEYVCRVTSADRRLLNNAHSSTAERMPLSGAILHAMLRTQKGQALGVWYFTHCCFSELGDWRLRAHLFDNLTCIRMLYSLSKQWSWPDMDGVELFVHLLLNLTVTATSIIWRVKTNYLLTLAVIYWNNPAGLISDWISVAVNLSAFHTVTATKRVFYCSCVSYHNR